MVAITGIITLFLVSLSTKPNYLLVIARTPTCNTEKIQTLKQTVAMFCHILSYHDRSMPQCLLYNDNNDNNVNFLLE